MEFAKEKKLKKIILEAHENNLSALNFYKKMKFKKIGFVKPEKIGFELGLKR